MIEIKRAEPGDSDKLTLRPEDQAEVSPEWRAHVEAEIAHGFVLCYWAGPTLVAMFGITKAPDLLGPWLLCSDHINAHRGDLMAVARACVDEFRTYAETVGNYIGKHAHANRKFIQKLGFLIIKCPSGDHDFFYLPRTHV
jgi:hypothetical protein